MAAPLSLFFHGPLLRPDVVAHMRVDQLANPIPDEAAVLAEVRSWIGALGANKALGEAALEQRFNSSILGKVLGYTLFPQEAGTIATAWPKPPARATHLAGPPDVALGEFDSSSNRFLAVVELKTPGTNLDAPQARVPPLTPIQQAFEYAQALIGVRWVIVSDMRLIRLYEVGDSTSYELFDLQEVARGGDPLGDFHALLSHRSLVAGGDDSYLSRLVATSLDKQQDLRAEFYDVYSQIRQDLYTAIAAAPELATLPAAAGHQELLAATQRLLDRLLFIYYCEDHPDRLLPKNTLRNAVQAASFLPGTSATRTYEVIKNLFREIDTGSVAGSVRSIPGYNGELFKPDPIVDVVSLPDALATKVFRAKIGNTSRSIRGAYGLDVFNFWSELNEHLLGHIFEESLSDLSGPATLAPSFGIAPASPPKSIAERKAHGIFYTSQLITDFLVQSAVADLLSERVPAPAAVDETAVRNALDGQIAAVQSIRAVDLSCGSGAFLVSTYTTLLRTWRQAQSSLNQLGGKSPDLGLFAAQQAQFVRSALFGSDLLPQAIEISKLALWLRSARVGEKVSDLHGNLVACDSLDVPSLLTALKIDAAHMATFDLVVGNPPWGGDVDTASRSAVCAATGLDASRGWDSWELFVALSLKLLKVGGRLALVLPDTLFHPEKRATRELLNQSLELERLEYLGPDWFGPKVRMGTVLLQGRMGRRTGATRYRGVLLAGQARRDALRGRLRLSQAEAALSLPIPQSRIDRSDSTEFAVGVSDVDDALLSAIGGASSSLSALCQRGRGEEINRDALLWQCPSCLRETVPGRKRKGGGFHDKACPHCGITLVATSVTSRTMLRPFAAGGGASPGMVSWLDGDIVVGRYRQLAPTHFLSTTVAGWPYKAAALYQGPKVLIRQAGVGLSATLDPTDARVPQSIYVYRLTSSAAAAGYSLNFILGALLSRTMHYVLVKKFQEVDPARAHAKVTHARLEDLPIPVVDFSDPIAKAFHDGIVSSVARLLSSSSPNGSPADLEVEANLRALYGITPLGGAYINGELGKLPEGAAKHELFPAAVPIPLVLGDRFLAYG